MGAVLLGGCEDTRQNRFMAELYGTAEPETEALVEASPEAAGDAGRTHTAAVARPSSTMAREVIRSGRRLPPDPETEARLARALGAEAGPREPLEAGITPNSRAVMLNFVGAPIGDFVDTVFGQALGANYYLDPGVDGRVTLQTSRKVLPRALLGVAEEILRANGAEILYRDGLYIIRPAASEAETPARSVRLLTLDYLAVDQVNDLIQPFSNDDVSVSGLPGGAVLVVGTAEQVAAVADLIEVFDVDPLAGRQLALLPLRAAPAVEVADELTRLLETPATEGRFEILPVERMNAVLLVADSVAVLREARRWVHELDQGGAADSTGQVFVYEVQNRRASDLAEVLSALYSTGSVRARRSSRSSRTVTPDLTEAVFSAEATGSAGSAPAPVTAAAIDGPRESGPTQSAIDLTVDGETVRIFADDGANSIVTRASPASYRTIEAALRQLDVVPLQVLIEATIAEVVLSDRLEYGVRWFFESGDLQGTFTDNVLGAVAPSFPGFNLLLNTTSVRAVVSALDDVTDVDVISTPSMMVLDNQTASLQVGDQVPVAVQSAVDVTNPSAPIVNSIEFRDTGVILRVTPRVNSSGLVVIDIRQEVSDVAQTTSSTIDSPTIQQRAFSSTVAIKSGEAILLGGLIRNKRTRGRAGIPVLSDIPVLGALASTTSNDQVRTELIVILKPTVVRSTADAVAVTEEMRRKLKGIGRLHQPTTGG